MLDFYVVSNERDIARDNLRPRVSLEGAPYWFLHRYFVQADLSPGDFSFLNPYEDTELQGYQLHRLKTELEIARLDLSGRSGSFRVLTGWLGEVRSLEAEDWKIVQVEELDQIISQLLELLVSAASY
jgi:hypothetical protein